MYVIVGNDNNDKKRLFDETIQLAENAMLKHRKELFYEWDFEKNNNLGLDVYKITQGSGKIAWWICTKCKSEYDMVVGTRAGKKKANCPYCRGYRVNSSNSLASLRSDIAAEWHPTLNGDLTPDDVTQYSNEKMWWLGECGHEWNATIDNRTIAGNGCSVCYGQSILIGFNDMWTTAPNMAKQLLDPEDGYKYTKSSNVNVDWKCSMCENIIKHKMINNVLKNGVSCPRCSDGIPFGEKFVYTLLKEFGIEFDFDRTKEWSKKTRYDFYFNYKDEPYIIEVHGVQHYERSIYGDKSRTVQEEWENDVFKQNLAKDNGVKNYIIIDARKSTVEWLEDSILKSNLPKIIKYADFERVGSMSSRSIIKESCDLWNTGIKSVSQISELLKLSKPTIATYLKRGIELGWCDYCPKEAMRLSALSARKHIIKAVVQLDKNLNFLACWDSAREATRKTGANFSTIALCARGKNKTSGGFIWMFKKDYDEMLQEELSHKEYMDKYYPKN